MLQNYKTIHFLVLILLGSMFCYQATAQKQDMRLYKSLQGKWRFSIGDRPEWKTKDFNDASWEKINVPGAWEEQGFNGYDGYAWYRIRFYLPADASKLDLWLDLGFIDDVDECYLNGTMIGKSGYFPPSFKTAFKAHRQYQMNSNSLIYGGENTLAVRVYDAYNEGGILSGSVGIYQNTYPLLPNYTLPDKWKFVTGDEKRYSSVDFNDDNWSTIKVPGRWEDQGYEHYDGLAWYRVTVKTPNAGDEPLVLLLGKIDDVDEVYVNGELIGNTGLVDPSNFIYIRAFDNLRGYYIPPHLIKNKPTITIAVRVYDQGMTGGIYTGPIGLIKQRKYVDYWRGQSAK